MCGVTKLDRIQNEIIRGTTNVGEISRKMQGSRLKWYGYVMRRIHVCNRVMATDTCAREEKERKTETAVNGQHQARLNRKGIIGQRDAIQGCMEATNPKHRSILKVV